MASLGTLTAGIAHEIKNPLNFVNSFARLNERLCRELDELISELAVALEPADRTELAELLADLGENSRKILQHGERADRIVVGMLQHSRGGGGEFAPADLNKMIEEYSHLAYHGLRANRPDLQVALEFQLDRGLAPFEMVASDLSRVLLNLVNNACYAAADRCQSEPGHQAKVCIQSEDLGARVRLTVRDNGLGMPAEIQNRIFEPFFTTKPTGSGTGLGLSISYDIVVKLHRGELEVQSEPGVGTLFTILLPKQQKG
jgi:signal transduction histidine kinase